MLQVHIHCTCKYACVCLCKLYHKQEPNRSSEQGTIKVKKGAISF